MALAQVAVLVPLHLRIAVGHLNETHAALGEAAGQQTLPAEVGGERIVQPVEPARRRRIRR